MPYPMIEMVVIDGIRYKPADAARRGHKAVSPNVPVGVEPTEVVEINAEGVVSTTTEETEEAEEAEVVQPSKGGSKADWVAYAVAQGADPSDVEDMSRDEIAETYGE